MAPAPVIALSHGGGPLPLLGDPQHAEIVNSLQTRVPKLLRLGTNEQPRAIIVVTAHWSTRKPTISSGSRPSLYYDYGGFPAEAYKLKYDAPGSPEIAKEVFDAYKQAGLDPQLDEERGWDHGVFVPMLLIAPQTRIPIIQVSVLKSEDPHAHAAMGEALSSLRTRSNIAIVGSGFASFHNIRAMLSGSGLTDQAFLDRQEAWSKELSAAVEESDPETRAKKLARWRDFTASYEMHPRGGADHFMPLLVCAGAGGSAKAGSYVDRFMGLPIFSFYWD